MNDTECYNDIIDLPHHQSQKHPHMTNAERAAQFSPFAALKGYDDEIEEAARTTEEWLEQDESRLSLINDMLNELKMREKEHPKVTVAYFLEDERKSGGEYRTLTGHVKKVDAYSQRLYLDDVTVRFEQIIDLNIDENRF